MEDQKQIQLDPKNATDCLLIIKNILYNLKKSKDMDFETKDIFDLCLNTLSDELKEKANMGK